jgi:phenylpyruvate tautomerase PptA (4-oxalocrotonate tautomerase family)
VTGMYYPEVTLYVEVNDSRTIDQKRALAQLLTNVCLEVLRIAPDDVSVRFRILRHEDMARGGRLLVDRTATPSSADP